MISIVGGCSVTKYKGVLEEVLFAFLSLMQYIIWGTFYLPMSTDTIIEHVMTKMLHILVQLNN